jgi:hypothetical protein
MSWHNGYSLEDFLMAICFTGARKINEYQNEILINCLSKIDKYQIWHIGDAKGVDATAVKFAENNEIIHSIYTVQNKTKRYAYAERSKRMIDACVNGILYAFPTKSCPFGCAPSKNPKGGGSGTWLTIAYAQYKGLKIVLIPLADIKSPQWLEAKQLSLF